MESSDEVLRREEALIVKQLLVAGTPTTIMSSDSGNTGLCSKFKQSLPECKIDLLRDRFTQYLVRMQETAPAIDEEIRTGVVKSRALKDVRGPKQRSRKAKGDKNHSLDAISMDVVEISDRVVVPFEFPGLNVDWRRFPRQVFEEGVVKYNRSEFDFASVVREDVFGGSNDNSLSSLPLIFVSTWRPTGTREGVANREDVARWSENAARNHDHIRTCTRLNELYAKFIREVIGPHLIREVWRERMVEKALSARSAALVETQATSSVTVPVTVLYQFPPTVRSFASEKRSTTTTTTTMTEDLVAYKSLGRMHNDAEFGHQPGETNFWLPLTEVNLDNTLWVESGYQRGDWRPVLIGREHSTDNEHLDGDLAEVFWFNGTLARHFARCNSSGKTRVSLDFRCTLEDVFEHTWRSPYIEQHAHERHRMEFLVDVDLSNGRLLVRPFKVETY